MGRPLLFVPVAWAVIASLASSDLVPATTVVAEEFQVQEQQHAAGLPAGVTPLIHSNEEPATPVATLLEDARLKYLEGSAAEALSLLDAADLAIADTEEKVAWLELYAFLLTATGAHQAAFDSLHMMHTLKTRALQQQRVDLQEQLTDSLASWSRQWSSSREAFRNREDELKSTNRTLSYALAGLAMIAGCLLIFLVFTRRPREAGPPAVRTPPVAAVVIGTPVKGTAAVETTDVRTAGSNEALLPHIERLSKLVSGGSTIDAAVYLDVLKRYLRMMRPLEAHEWLPLQETVTLLRQQLKLSAMLLEVRPEYVVNVAADLRDAQVHAPARSLVTLLQETMPGDQNTKSPRMVVEFSRDGAHIKCDLRSNKHPITDGRSIHLENDPAGVIVRQVDAGKEGVGLEVTWPGSMPKTTV